MQKNVEFQNHQVYEINQEDSVIRIAPQFGARLLDWHVMGKPVIYWPEDANWEKVPSVRGGNPILFPFIARHMVNGEIGWWIDSAGTKRALPMHGFARNNAFNVIPETDPSMFRMRFESSPQTREAYPFDFTFDVVYKLGANSLESRLEVTNTGNTSLPYYTGHHFYFSVPHDQREKWQVNIPCERHGRQQPDGSIPETPADSDTHALTKPTLSDMFHIGIRSPKISLLEKETSHGVVIDLDMPGSIPWYAITTWVEKTESDFYCVEPWTGLPNAIHHGKGLRHLAPGTKESAICVIHVK